MVEAGAMSASDGLGGDEARLYEFDALVQVRGASPSDARANAEALARTVDKLDSGVLVIPEGKPELIEGEQAHGDGKCPECGSEDICAQTASDDRTPWGCLACDAQFEEPDAIPSKVEARELAPGWQVKAPGAPAWSRIRAIGNVTPGKVEAFTEWGSLLYDAHEQVEAIPAP